MLNYGVTPTCDEVLQIVQWKHFCIRSCILIAWLIMALWLNFDKPVTKTIILSIVCICAIEATYAVMQLYGLSWSHHTLYKQTGSFYNPGPLGGFLAVGFVVTLYLLLHEKHLSTSNQQIINIKTLKTSLTHKHLYYATIAIIILIAMVLPSTMSRTAWFAALCGSLYIVANSTNWRRFLPRKKWQKTIFTTCIAVLIAITTIGAWHLKSGSAIGRVFMWKISTIAVANSPLIGHNNFKHAYAEAQEQYFEECGSNSDGTINANEFFVNAAGCPDYAFNEYLNIAVEYGIPVLLCILLFITSTIIVGHRNKQHEMVGGTITIMIFALASYPIHLPVFVALLLLLILGCWWNTIIANKTHKVIATFTMLIIGLLCFVNIAPTIQKEIALREWGKVQHFYSMKSYDTACYHDSILYNRMKWNGRFLYEYGHALHNIKRYNQSNKILHEADLLLNDPMTLNVIGKNYQMLGMYQKAEYYYTKSANRVPNRLYPHYLMFKMYSDTINYNYFKAKHAANIIINKQVKIESDATKQMIHEAKVFLEKNDF